MFKILSTYICWKIYIYKMQHLEGSGTSVLYIGHTVLKRLTLFTLHLFMFFHLAVGLQNGRSLLQVSTQTPRMHFRSDSCMPHPPPIWRRLVFFLPSKTSHEADHYSAVPCNSLSLSLWSKYRAVFTKVSAFVLPLCGSPRFTSVQNHRQYNTSVYYSLCGYKERTVR
jgi:hypothetical protein